MAQECQFLPKTTAGETAAKWRAWVINDDWCAHHGDNYGATVSHRASGFGAFTFAHQDPEALADAAKECEPPNISPGADAQVSWLDRDAVIAWLNRVAVRVGADWGDIVRLSDAMVRAGRRPR